MNGSFNSARRCSLLRALVPWLFVAIAGCGGGGGGGDIGISRDDQAADPATADYPIAYVRRPLPEENAAPQDLRDPFAFNPGAELLVRKRADGDAPELNITRALFGEANAALYDVKDLDVSPDGRRLIFALHPPLIEGADPRDQPTWSIWEYQFDSGALRRIITSDNRAQQGNDVAPHYLPDGRIAFVSDRQAGVRAYLTGTGVPAYSALEESLQRKAGVLHLMDADGQNLEQISFNQSHDLDPALLRSGKLVFTRWDRMGNNSRMSLYTINPSGMALSSLYGYYSQDTGTDAALAVAFSQPREMADGRIAAILRPAQTRSLGGDLVALDAEHFSDHDQPVWENLGASGSGQATLAYNEVRTDGELSPGGQFGAAFPLWDGSDRLLVSWSQCRAIDGNRIVPCTLAPADAEPAPPLYGLWIYTPAGGDSSQRPVVPPQEGVIFTDVVAGAPAKAAGTATDPRFDSDTLFAPLVPSLAFDQQAVVDIRSVYNIDGAVVPANGSPNTGARARFIQFIQPVPIPDPDDEVFAINSVNDIVIGISRAQLLRQIIGYAPIRNDGSVVVKLPANVPFTFNLLDGNAQRLGAPHQVWWQLRPGEVLRCGGCHAGNSQRTHGRLESTVPDILPAGRSQAEQLFAGDPGQTLSVNVVGTDINNLPVDYSYVIGGTAQVPVAPTSAPGCATTWRNDCRIAIDYVEHIQPVWDRCRPAQSAECLDADPTTVGSATCTGCHVSPWLDNGVPRPPAGQLELTNTPSDRSALFIMSYTELLTTDNEVDNTGADVLITVPVLDDAGNPVLDDNGIPLTTQAPVTVPSPMTTGGARASARFFNCFNGGSCGANTVDHVNFLTAGELRLLSEWLDIGGQYHNDIRKATAQ